MASQGTKRRILVVDDEPDITTTLQIGLEAGGFDVDALSIRLIALTLMWKVMLTCRGWTGISNDVRLGAQQFRVNMNIKGNNASKEQINELYEIGKRFSPAFDTLTNGTSVVLVNS